MSIPPRPPTELTQKEIELHGETAERERRFQETEDKVEARIKWVDKRYQRRQKGFDGRLKKLEDLGGEINTGIKRLQKMKEEILQYTLQIVSIVIGLFALILGVGLVFTHPSPTLLTVFHVATVVLFFIVFIWWFILWGRYHSI